MLKIIFQDTDEHGFCVCMHNAGTWRKFSGIRKPRRSALILYHIRKYMPRHRLHCTYRHRIRVHPCPEKNYRHHAAYFPIKAITRNS
ncbi:MAG: hypothetical protein GY749_07385 [Desulfobacteraceae bacterium]|nr:hypothetical protein [Desulfobacteraceae bacterium]